MNIDHTKLLEDEALKDCKIYGDVLSSHLRNDYATVIGITGAMGTGKSTLGIWTSYCINPFEFEIAKNCVVAPESEEFIKQFESLSRYSGLLGDESAWYAYNRTFMKSFQIYLMQYLKTSRKHHNKAIILCMTSVHKFDKDLRTGDTMFNWIHLLDRGIGVVFQSTRNFFSNDGFRIRENERLFEEWKGRKKDNQIDLAALVEFLEQKASNFIDIIRFPDLPPEWKKEYLGLTINAQKAYKEHRDKMHLESHVREERRYESLCRLSKWLYEGDEKAPARTFEEIGEKIGIAPSTILRWHDEAERLETQEERKV